MDIFKNTIDVSKINYILDRFSNHTLKKSEWTHEAHLIVGLWYVETLGLSEAREQLRRKIQSLNIALGGENTDTSGYHETITFYWLQLSEFFLSSLPTKLTFEEKCNLFLKNELCMTNSALRFFSSELLFSKEARYSLVSPDKQALSSLIHFFK